jgi:sodium/bile acid cotransporter 7
MRALFCKRWFLLLLLVGVGLAWWRPHWLRPLTNSLDPRVIVATALFLIAWSLESRSLFRSFVRPIPALWAVLISHGLVPVLAWSAGWLLPDADLRIGLFIIASVPCTLASAVIWTRLGRGNEATALLVILLTTATSWLTTTAWLAFGIGGAGAADISGMMQGLALILIVPVGIGQLSRTIGPLVRAATRYKSVLGIVSQLLILVMIVKAAVDVSDKLGERTSALAMGPLLVTAAVCLGTHLAALAAGFWSSGLLRLGRSNQIAIAFAGSQKTLPVALLLFDSYYKEDYPLALVPMLFYHAGQLVADTMVADMLAHRQWPPDAKSSPPSSTASLELESGL